MLMRMKGPIKPSLILQRELTIFTLSILLKGTSTGLQNCSATSPFPIFLVCDWDLNQKPADPPPPPLESSHLQTELLGAF